MPTSPPGLHQELARGYELLVEQRGRSSNRTSLASKRSLVTLVGARSSQSSVALISALLESIDYGENGSLA